MSKRITLKKYPNRRLYDTLNSTYVTLDDVASLIREGHQIEVIDLKTDQNVTAFILTQIIMEQTKRNHNLLPVSFLHLIIRFGENVLSDFFDQYLEKIIENYIQYKKRMEDQFRVYMDMGIDLSSLTEKTMQQMASFAPKKPENTREQPDREEEHSTEK